MRKNIATSVAALALTAGLTVAPAQATSTCAASADGCRTGADGCATYGEQSQLRLGMRRATVRRILGTRGRVVGKRTMANNAGGIVQMLGLSPSQIDSPRAKHRQVRRYATCAEDGVPALLLVEYRIRGGHGRATQILWK